MGVELPVGLVVIVDVLLEVLVPLGEAPPVVVALDEDEPTVLPLINVPEGVGAGKP